MTFINFVPGIFLLFGWIFCQHFICVKGGMVGIINYGIGYVHDMAFDWWQICIVYRTFLDMLGPLHNYYEYMVRSMQDYWPLPGVR